MADDKVYPTCSITGFNCNSGVNMDMAKDETLKKYKDTNERAMDDIDFMTNTGAGTSQQFNCGCVGYAYVPWHMMNQTYSSNDALMQGTIFPELDLSMKEYGKVCKQFGGTVNGK